jgi:hypothetical protein
MVFLYPAGLISSIKNKWANQPAEWRALWLPSERSLREILDTIYQASLLAEEGRPLSVHIAYATDELFSISKDHGHYAGCLLRLDSPRAFTLKEILRIAPAIDPWKTAILIRQETTHRTGSHNTPLFIWGFLNLGADRERGLAGEAIPHSNYTPDFFTVTSSSPGELVVGSGGWAFIMLSAGSNKPIQAKFPIHDLLTLFGPFIQQLDALAFKCFRGKSVPKASVLGYSYWSEYTYIDILKRLVALTIKMGHGACFIFVPEEMTCNGEKVLPLRSKYQINVLSLGDAIALKTVRNLERLAKSGFGPLRSIDGVDPDILPNMRANTLVQRALNGGDLNRIIEDVVASIADFSQVDGAVLLSTQLSCKAFGCEIRTVGKDDFVVKRATKYSGRVGQGVPIDSFGTRHRSTFRFCYEVPHSIGIVVSQDGSAKVCTRISESVVFWDVTPPGVFFEWPGTFRRRRRHARATGPALPKKQISLADIK